MLFLPQAVEALDEGKAGRKEEEGEEDVKNVRHRGLRYQVDTIDFSLIVSERVSILGQGEARGCQEIIKTCSNSCVKIRVCKFPFSVVHLTHSPNSH